MDITITTPATATSIDVDLVKASKRILHGKEDALIEFWIKAAEDFIEKRLNASLMQRTLTMSLSRVLPMIQLPYPPLISLTSMKYTVDGQTETTINPSTEMIRTNADMLATYAIPALSKEYAGTMTAVYTAGYATPEEVPPSLRQAVLLLAGYYVTNREAAFLDPRAIQVERKIVYGVDQLVGQYRVPNTQEPVNGGY